MQLVAVQLLVVFLAAAEVWTEEPGWSLKNQEELQSSNLLNQVLLRMSRKPRPHQFIGLMGRKRSMANAQVTRKRHKINSFVGLMGKRSEEEPGSYEWSTIQTYGWRH